ncbi:MAG: cytochrome c biogenesis CcdA family protein [Canibacter sp.]
MTLDGLITDGGLWLAILVSLAAGVVSFISPCVLPLVPGYLAFVSGSATTATAAHRGSGRKHMRALEGQGRMVWGVVLFVLGFTAVFVSFLTLVGSFAVWLVQWEAMITRVMGVIIILLGLVFIGLLGPMQRTKRTRIRPKLGLVGAPLLGAAFAIGWTPCIGPTLALIMGLSLQQGSATRGMILGIAYCIGLGLPFILVALGFGWMASATGWVKRHMRVINITGGVLLIVIGLAMVTGIWTKIMYALQAVIGGFVTPL